VNRIAKRSNDRMAQDRLPDLAWAHLLIQPTPMPHPGACQTLSRVMVKDAETARAIPIDGIEQQQPPGGFRQGGEVNARCLLWANMSAISTAGARIDRRDNGRHLTPLPLVS
jgi:hypothetical protein